MAMNSPLELGFFLNPFTRECIYLPISSKDPFVISTWRPGETVWTIHRFKNQSSSGKWLKCVFSNGVFYGFSNCGNIGVYNPPCSTTWDVLPVMPWDSSTFFQIDFNRIEAVLMIEHNGNIFVMSTRRKNKFSVFKLNIERMAWEEKSEVFGLTVLTSYPDSFEGSENIEKVRKQE
uniref:KIB1-4 beta-propeller domain-containing protein n=1 Tax=Brassica oleracea var. oleracea TaxID=109376 RepID=A0A0D3D3G1_BRAOL